MRSNLGQPRLPVRKMCDETGNWKKTIITLQYRDEGDHVQIVSTEYELWQ